MSDTPENPTQPTGDAPLGAAAAASTPSPSPSSPTPHNLTQVIISVLVVTAVGFVAGRVVGRPDSAPEVTQVRAIPLLRRAPLALQPVHRSREELNKRLNLRAAFLRHRDLMVRQGNASNPELRQAYLRTATNQRESGVAAAAVRGRVDDCLHKVGTAAQVAVRFDVQPKGDTGASLANAQVVAANFTDDAVKRCVVDAVNGGQVSTRLRPVSAVTASFSVGAAAAN